MTSACVKRRYRSIEAARKAHPRAGWRLRPYLCPQCHGYHVANGEKRWNRRQR